MFNDGGGFLASRGVPEGPRPRARTSQRPTHLPAGAWPGWALPPAAPEAVPEALRHRGSAPRNRPCRPRAGRRLRVAGQLAASAPGREAAGPRRTVWEPVANGQREEEVVGNIFCINFGDKVNLLIVYKLLFFQGSPCALV